MTKDGSRMFMPADKSNCTVVQSSNQYFKIGYNHIASGLKNGPYTKLSEDPTQKIVFNLRKCLRKIEHKIDKDDYVRMFPSYDGLDHVALYYNLPKLHKLTLRELDVPGVLPAGRPINSMCGTPCILSQSSWARFCLRVWLLYQAEWEILMKWLCSSETNVTHQITLCSVEMWFLYSPASQLREPWRQLSTICKGHQASPSYWAFDWWNPKPSSILSGEFHLPFWWWIFQAAHWWCYGELYGSHCCWPFHGSFWG